MALTPTEEAQTRALIAQEAALLALAAEEPAIISNLGATDVSLSDLSSASSLADADLLLVRQGGTDKSISGLIVKAASTVTVPDASETVKGIVEFATVAETQSGTSTILAVHPAGLAASSHPVGSIIWVAKTSAPTGHLKANGAAISRTTYATLFAAIGTTFGVGDGSTTFNVPDLRGEFIRGWDDGRGVDTSRAFGSAQAHSYQAHTHPSAAGSLGVWGASGNPNNLAYASGGNASTMGEMTTGTGNAGTETRPRNISLLACIKF